MCGCETNPELRGTAEKQLVTVVMPGTAAKIVTSRIPSLAKEKKKK